MSWELPWVKAKGYQGGFVIKSVHQGPNDADITDTRRDSAYMCENHADMIVKAVNNHTALVSQVIRLRDILQRVHSHDHEEIKVANDLLAKLGVL